MRKLYAYQKYGTCPVQKFVDSLNGKLKTKFLFQLSYITDEKNSFAEPYVKHFSMGKYRLMYELRVKAAERMVRIIFYEKTVRLSFCTLSTNTTEKIRKKRSKPHSKF